MIIFVRLSGANNRTSAAIIMEICYGHHVAEKGDEYVTLADEALAAVNQSSIFGSYMVDYLPWR